MWLDSCVSFNAHISKRFGKAMIAKSKIKGLNKTYRQFLGQVQQIQVAAVQLVVLYDTEIL